MSRISSLDAIDLEILRILAEDCTTSIKEISKRVGISQPMVRKRIKRMKSWGLIKGCKAQIDPEVAGATSYMIFLELKDVSSVYDLASKFNYIERVYVSTSKNIGFIIVRVEDLRGVDALTKAIEDMGHKIIKIALLDIEYERVWVPEAPRDSIQPKCAFCNRPIIGKPYTVALDDGTILMFNSRECAEAYMILKREKKERS